MNSYLFSIGNSDTNNLGACFRVFAPSKSEAVIKAKEQIEGFDNCLEDENKNAEGLEYLHVYFNVDHITEDDIDEINRWDMFEYESFLPDDVREILQDYIDGTPDIDTNALLAQIKSLGWIFDVDEELGEGHNLRMIECEDAE